MKDILVVGGGGREHAIVWKLKQSSQAGKIYCAPGNGGIAAIAECLPIKASDIDAMVKAVKDLHIDLVIVAPDDPLAAGMVDRMTEAGIRAFGPAKSAARLESSKIFSKNLMKKYNIPTAKHEVFTDYDEAVIYLKNACFPIVVKCDGLAMGKGVVIALNFNEAVAAVDDMIRNRVFGASGKNVVIEEFLVGPEVTVLAFVDGKTVSPMVSSQDHKRALDADLGPNTGGMGAFAPSEKYDEKTAELCMKTIFKPTLEALRAENILFKGVIYFGLMLTPDGPKVIEYNARFGDPEAQVVLPLLDTDLIDIFDAVIDERLDEIKIKWSRKCAATVVMASGGYPKKYETGFAIKGIQEAEKMGAIVFHAGTQKDGSGGYKTAGGRVLDVTAVANDLPKALTEAYKAVERISFENMHFRRDIGVK